MSKRFIAATAAVAAFSFASVPCFASSGYGPAPHYNPVDGAPASQRGQSAQTIRTDTLKAQARELGGVADTTTQASGHAPVQDVTALYSHH